MPIQISDITNNADTGIFDQLMAAVNKHIDDQYLNNRITGSDYANVYLGSMQAVLAQSVQFALQEQLTEAQTDGVLADNLIKTKQLEIVEQELLAAYTDRVLKDKQVAKLGLDNVMKKAEESKATDPNFTYTPKYTETV